MNKAKRTILAMYVYGALTGVHLISATLYTFFTQWGGFPKENALAMILGLQSWFMVCGFLLETPTGFIADKYGRKASLMVGGLFLVAYPLVYSYKPYLPLFVLAEFLCAAGLAFRSGADESLLMEASREEGMDFGKVWGRYKSLHIGGMLVGAPLGSFIATNWGVRYPTMFQFVPEVLGLVVLIFVSDHALSKAKKTGYLDNVKKSIAILRNQKRLGLACINLAVMATCGICGIWLYQPLLTSLGVDVLYFGFVHAGFVALEVVLMSVVFPKITNVSSHLLFSGVLAGLGFIAGAVFNQFQFVILGIVVAIGFTMSISPAISKIAHKEIQYDSVRATTMSTVYLIRKFVQSVANPVVGALADWNLRAVFGGIGILLFVFTLWWHRAFSKTEEMPTLS